MKNFNKAVDRARALRNPANLDASHDNMGETSEVTSSKPVNQTIEYTQTQTLTPNAALLASNHVIAADTDPSVTAAYNMLRTQVLQNLNEHSWNTLAITSPSAGDGKTLTAVNLAISIARDVTHTVLLVDLDLRNPSVHTTLGCKPSYGIGDYLIDNTPVSEILFTTDVQRLVVLPGRQSIQNPAEQLSSPKMMRLVDELKRRYETRIVIFDLPPLLATDDALAFSPFVDSALLVVEEGSTSVEDVRKAMGYLKHTPILGTVLNRSIHKVEN